MELAKQSRTIVQGIRIFFILLFTYAAANQLLELQEFLLQLEQSPFIGAFAEWLVWLIPAAEVSIVLLLFNQKLWRLAFIASSVLMISFTAYITAVLNFAESIPCSCGGVIPFLSWQEHLFFNIVCSLLALLGLILSSLSKKQESDSQFQKTNKNHKDFLLQQKQAKPKT